MGGVVQGLEEGWFQRKIAEAAARQQWEIEQHRKLIVGVNEFVTDEPELTIPMLRVGEEATIAAARAPGAMRATRDNALVRQRLDALRTAARRTGQPGPVHSRLRARLLHAVRDSRRAGGRVRRVSRAGVLLSHAEP